MKLVGGFSYRDQAASEFTLNETDLSVNNWRSVFRSIALFLILIVLAGLFEYLRGNR